MHRFWLLIAALFVGLIVACGSGDDGDGAEGGDGDSSEPAASGASSAGGGSDRDDSGGSRGSSSDGADSDFCSPEGAEAVFDGMDFTTPGDLEAQLGGVSSALDAWVDNAPSDIRDDASVAAETMRGLIELLEEYDYGLLATMASAAGDPRFVALESSAFTEATNRISEYCGIEVEAPTVGGGAGDTPFNPTFGEGELPEDFPDELVPPASEVGLTAVAGLGATIEFQSTGTLEEIKDFYNDVLGQPSFSDGESTVWLEFSASGGRTVPVIGSDGELLIVVVLVASG